MSLKENITLRVCRITDALFYRYQVPILYYHRVNNLPSGIDNSPTVEFFRRQIQLLYKRGYYFASLIEVIDWCKGLIDLPQNTIAITFDDGYEDNYTNVFPILKKYNAKATIFLIHDYIGQTRYFSYNRNVPQKILPEDYNPSIDLEHKYLTVPQIKEMYDSGLVDFGSHTLSHNSLVYCDIYKAIEEIVESKKALEKLLDQPVDTFCYPYGHYNEIITKNVANAGYKGAVTTNRRRINRGDSVYHLSRINDINLLVNLPPVIRKLK
jgi:peptidoglycan/xylan/chitin deacetylase (PgdA/CDA1 family)